MLFLWVDLQLLAVLISSILSFCGNLLLLLFRFLSRKMKTSLLIYKTVKIYKTLIGSIVFKQGTTMNECNSMAKKSQMRNHFNKDSPMTWIIIFNCCSGDKESLTYICAHLQWHCSDKKNLIWLKECNKGIYKKIS